MPHVDSRLLGDFLDLELWRLTLARSYEFSEKLADEIYDRDAHKRYAGSILRRAGANFIDSVSTACATLVEAEHRGERYGRRSRTDSVGDSLPAYDGPKAQDFGTFAAVARLDMLSNFIEKTCEMRPTALALTFLAVLVLLRPAPAGSESQDLLSKLSITQQSWWHSGKLLIANITFRNDNSFPVQRVVVSCQITGDPARPQDSRGVTIRQDVSRGDMTVRGVEFPVTNDKAQGGPCKVDSAERAR